MKNFTKSIVKMITLLALGASVNAFAAEKEPQIANDSANLPAELTQNIAKTAIAMGVKEPLMIAKEDSNAKISGSNATVCTFKLSGEKMLGLSCK